MSETEQTFEIGVFNQEVVDQLAQGQRHRHLKDDWAENQSPLHRRRGAVDAFSTAAESAPAAMSAGYSAATRPRRGALVVSAVGWSGSASAAIRPSRISASWPGRSTFSPKMFLT